MTATEAEKPDPRTVVPVPSNPGSPNWGVKDPVREAMDNAWTEQAKKAREAAAAGASSPVDDEPAPEPAPEP
jgi:hypothetical protein